MIKKHGLSAPDDPNELHKAVANSLETHKHKTYWIKNVFLGKMRRFRNFIKEQSKPGQFIDNNGIMVILTSDYLGVKYHLVGTSNNAQNPFTVLGNEDHQKVFHVGLYQDTTDQFGLGGRSGHYQSLEPVPGMAVPCCKVDAELVTVSVSIERDVTIAIQERVEAEAIEKIKVEENILKMFKKDKDMVHLSLKRILDVKNVSTDVLFNTDISNILYTDMRPLYSKNTVQGKLCRKILSRYQDLCKLDPRMRNEELPPISDISEDEHDTGGPVRNFRSLFSSARRSMIVSEINHESSEISGELPVSSHLASSTILDANPEDRRKTPPPMSLIFSEDLEFALAEEVPSSQISWVTSPARPEGSDQGQLSPTVVLTPPPPTPSPPRRRRGRPVAQSTLPSVMVSSPPKRKRGRPAKTKSPVGQPSKKPRGRPRKEC